MKDLLFCCLPQPCHEEGRDRHILPGPLLQQLDETLHADGKAHARMVGSAQLLYQPVVAAPAGHRILRPQPLGLDLKGGADIVVEAPDELVI